MSYAFQACFSLQLLGASPPDPHPRSATGPDLPLLFKLHDIWLVDSQENHKNVAARCQILRLNCTKFDFGWGSAPDPAEGAYSAPTDLLDSRGLLLREGGEGRGRGRGRKG